MKIKTILKRTGFVIAALLLSFFWLFESVFSVKASAGTTTGTNSVTAESDVLDDLKNVQFDDENAGFWPENAPYIEKNYSLNFLTIMEGTKGELFVYVYQPCHDIEGLIASSISISTLPSNHEDAVWHLYDLTLLDNSGVFDKYQVSGFKMSSDSVRFYDISRISRPYNESVDKSGSSGDNVFPVAISDGQTVDEVPYEVGILYEVKTVNGLVTYHTSTVETIEITDKVVGKIRYVDGYGLVHKYCDSHFVAFSTDKQIDKLLEAELSYVWEEGYLYYDDGEDEWEIESGPNKEEITVKHDETGSNSGDKGLWGKKYTWSRIHEPSAFISDENIKIYDSKTKNDLMNMEWVLRFTETEYENSYIAQSSHETRISEVTILRLKFVTDGVPYNLGVVDNSQTGPDDPIGSADSNFDDFMDEVKQMFKDLENALKSIFDGIGGVIITIVCVVAGCALLSLIPGIGSIFGLLFGAIFKIIGWILKAIFFVIEWVFKIVFWVIVFPFNLIGKLFKRNKKNE